MTTRRLFTVLPAAAILVAAACGGDDLGTQPDPADLRADLVAGPVMGPEAALVGGIVEYDVGLANGGAERVAEGWYVRVYLSTDRGLGSGDILVDQFAVRRALSPSGTDTYGRSFKVPGDVPPDAYHLVSELDATGVIEEPIEDNNTAATAGKVVVTESSTGL